MDRHTKNLFDRLWSDFTAKNRVPNRVFSLIQKIEGSVANDHISLRTFNRREIDMYTMARNFLDLGYSLSGRYKYESEKLEAIHLEHPDPETPKIFISELRIELLSHAAQDIVHSLLDQVDFSVLHENPLCLQGRLWEISYQDYKFLSRESEYAAWLAAHGFVANHFSVDLNRMIHLNSVEKINHFVKENGFDLNDLGGEVKGSPEQLLEQSSTLAELIEVDFKGEKVAVPGGVVEFAKRYKDGTGHFFSGFVPTSAERNFESSYLAPPA